MEKVKTWEAKIFIGFREGYSDKVHTLEECYKVVQEHVDRLSWCVTVTSTKFIYKDGNESGAIIGIIHYPRLPSETKVLKQMTFDLAKVLKEYMGQKRVSVLFPDETCLIGEPEREEVGK